MGQQAGNEAVRLLGQAPGILRIAEHVLPVPEQGHVGVHARAVDAEDGLGHEGGVQAVFLARVLTASLKVMILSARAQGVGVFEVDLMLALSHLMVAGLDLKAHLLQGHADLPPGALPVVQRTQVEVARLVVGPGGGLAVVIGLEEEKLRLRAHVEGVIAHVLRLFQGPLEHIAGVSHEGGAVRVVYVADQAGHLAVAGPPGKMAKESRSG